MLNADNKNKEDYSGSPSFFLEQSYMLNVDVAELARRAIKYLIEGLAVAVAASYLPRRSLNIEEVIMIAVTAAATFAVLDLLAPSVSEFARQGAGWGIGTSLVGAPGLPGVPM